MTSDEIELISDGNGLAVIGDPSAVEAFLELEGLPSKDLGIARLSRLLSVGGAGTQAVSQFAENSGRWVKLSEKSAKDLQKYTLMKGPTDGIRRSVLTQNGKSKGFLEIVKTSGPVGTSPAVLSGAAGLMAQMAMQQAMTEVTDYLASIDAKLDDVLRAQKDAVISTMIGVGFDIDEAMVLREHIGRVNQVTWSKVQSASSTIARTQSYALLQLDALAESLEDKTRISSLRDAALEAERKTQEWLAILARCFQLQDAILVLELDRVLETEPDDLDGHRLGLRKARAERLEAISRSTERLLARMAAAATAANQKVLFNPSQSPAVVKSHTHVTTVVTEFHELLGIENGHRSLETRRWTRAASEVRDKARDAGADKVEAARRLSNEAREQARSVTGKLSSRLGERVRRRGADD